jgi:putative protease
MADLKESEAVGLVREYFRKPRVAAVEILKGKVKVGDGVRFKGYTTDFTQRIESMQVNHVDIPEAVKGDYVGIKVADRVRDNDRMFLKSGDEEVSL